MGRGCGGFGLASALTYPWAYAVPRLPPTSSAGAAGATADNLWAEWIAQGRPGGSGAPAPGVPPAPPLATAYWTPTLQLSAQEPPRGKGSVPFAARPAGPKGSRTQASGRISGARPRRTQSPQGWQLPAHVPRWNANHKDIKMDVNDALCQVVVHCETHRVLFPRLGALRNIYKGKPYWDHFVGLSHVVDRVAYTVELAKHYDLPLSLCSAKDAGGKGPGVSLIGR